MAWNWHRPLEAKGITFSVLTFLAVAIGGLILLIPPYFLQGTIEPIEGVRPYSALELEGRDLYMREGCINCHSQMIRPFKTETDRYGPFSMGGEGIYDRPFLYGSRRTGPDLARVGGKYPDSWHWIHFRNPREIQPRSHMPDYAFLAERPLDLSLTPRKLTVLRGLGHPYSEADVANAAAAASAQAEQVAASLRRDGIELGEVQAQSETIALIAYMQRLGTDIGASPAGDSVDCGLCVAVCPTGIDIRHGLQMECIGCTQCIDACDGVMDRIGRAPGLIAYRSLASLEGRRTRLARPRVLVYGALLALVGAGFGAALVQRALLDLQVERNASSLYQTAADGRISNAYTLHIQNRDRRDHVYRIRLEAPEGYQLVAGVNPVVIPATGSLEARVFVLAGAGPDSSDSPSAEFRPGTGIRFVLETVTEAALRVEEIATAPDWTPARALAWAAAVEGSSTHPLAAAIRERAAARSDEAPAAPAPAVTSRRAAAGLGVVAETDAGLAAVGSRALLAELGIPALPPEIAVPAQRWGERGVSLAFLAARGEGVAAFALADPPRPDAAAAVARLQRLGLQVALVSGDHDHAVRLAAARAGIAEHHSHVRPEAKVEHVRALRSAGVSVLMAGDGINDAAALAAADVGIAMGRGADVAIHAADAIVLAPRLGALADAVGLARAALGRVRENLALAVLYNVVAVPLAATGWLEPLGAAIATSLSSLVVTGNSTRLVRWQAPR